MIIKMYGEGGLLLGSTDLLGSIWTAVDDGFMNIKVITIKAYRGGRPSYLIVEDYNGKLINRGPIGVPYGGKVLGRGDDLEIATGDIKMSFTGPAR